MDKLEDIVRYRPKTIEDALEAMQNGLRFFHCNNDFRAIFLRAYYIITKILLQKMFSWLYINKRTLTTLSFLRRIGFGGSRENSHRSISLH